MSDDLRRASKGGVTSLTNKVMNDSIPASLGPSFLGVGASRCGTTWLYEQLAAHPDIWMTPQKEIHYFDRRSRIRSSYQYTKVSPNVLMRLISRSHSRRTGSALLKQIGSLTHLRSWKDHEEKWCAHYDLSDYSERWYRGLFLEGKEHAHRGEITPDYSILCEEDLRYMLNLFPDVKLIMLLRNPIHRAWSVLKKNKKQGKIDFDLADTDRVSAFLRCRPLAMRSNYLHCIDTYLKVIEPTKLLIGFYDAIESSPIPLLNEIAVFLDVSPSGFDHTRLSSRINASPKDSMPAHIHQWLKNEYAEMMNELAARIGSYAATWVDQPTSSNSGDLRKFQLSATIHPGVLT